MSKPAKVIVRHWEKKDIPAIVECHRAAYSDYPPESQYNERIHKMQYKDFRKASFWQSLTEMWLVMPPPSSCNRQVSRSKKILIDFVGDSSSMDYCTLLEMPNPDFKPEKRKIVAAALRKPLRKIRVCSAQYMMRPIKSWEEFVRNVKFFVDVADEYH
jgi:hypothetical protein